MALTDNLSMRRQRAAGVRPDSALLHVDWVLIGTAIFLAAAGLVLIKSTGGGFIQRQSLFVVLGVAAMITTMSIDYRDLVDNAVFIYGIAVTLLVLVLTPLGSEKKGAQGWFDFGPLQLQPAEVAKLAIIISLAAYGAAQRNQLDVRRIIVVLGISAVPVGLIFVQPDLGSALVFLAIVTAVLWMAGTPTRLLFGLLLLGVFSVWVAVRAGVLSDYQVDRLTAFVNPTSNTRDVAFNINQSKIAIGSGQVTGLGFGNGTQTDFGFVPEQHSDFIFTAAGEQTGLVGCGVILAAFGLLLARIWRAAASARDSAGTLVCVGVFALFLFHIFQNIGMTVGIMPITGIPLPFLSYGGSSTLVSFAAIGLVLSVEMRRFR
jgi:rod shape determining protein RodA